jgi:probable HAF family extracellular repeat protein
MSDLGTLGGNGSDAHSINDSGQTVGEADTSSGRPHAFLHSFGTMTDLGTLGGLTSVAQDINNSGQIVGNSTFDASGVVHAFLYEDGLMTDLGTLGGAQSDARGINNIGDIVGYAWTSNGETSAFIYHDGVMTDLNSLVDPDFGYHLSVANAINDRGQIVGYGRAIANGVTTAYLLTPAVVPEPSTFSAFTVWSLLCVIGASGRSQRRSLLIEKGVRTIN